MIQPKLKTLVFLLLSVLNFLEIQAQSCAGLTGGAGYGRLFDLRRDEFMEYESEYHFKSGFNFSGFYQPKNDRFRFELQYVNQKVDLITALYGGHVTGTLHNKMDYTFQQLNLGVLRIFHPVQKEKFQMNILLGVIAGYTLNTKAKGTYSSIETKSYVDTNGVSHNYTVSDMRTKDERNSNDLSRFNAGLHFGLEFVFPVSQKIDLLIQNRYNLFFTNYLKVEHTMSAALLSGALNVGVKYRFTGG